MIRFFGVILVFLSSQAYAQIEFSYQYNHVGSAFPDVTWGLLGFRKIEGTHFLSTRYSFLLGSKTELGPEYQFGFASIKPSTGGVSANNGFSFHSFGIFGRHYLIRDHPLGFFLSAGAGFIPSYPDILQAFKKETSSAFNFKLGAGLRYSLKKYSFILSYDWGLITANPHPDIDEKQQGLFGITLRREL